MQKPSDGEKYLAQFGEKLADAGFSIGKEGGF